MSESQRLLEKVISRSNLELAFKYVEYDKRKNSHFFDPLELLIYKANLEAFLDELEEDLKDITNYKTLQGYAFFPNKTELCHRRMIHIPIKDLILRYAFTIIIADKLKNKFSKTCFANRREITENNKIRLLEDFAETSWPEFCNWQQEMAKEYSVLLKTDISSFFDSVSHTHLLKLIADELSIKEDSDFIILLKKLLQFKVVYQDSNGKIISQNMEQGLAINNACEGFFANLYLRQIDKKLLRKRKIKYGRYVDDIRIWGNDKKTVISNLYELQKRLLSLNLNLNTSKTKLAISKSQIQELLSNRIDIIYDLTDGEQGKIEDIESNIDAHLDDINFDFDMYKRIKNSKEAKLFCKILNSNVKFAYYIPLEKRDKKHIQQLIDIIERFPNVGKFASWLLVHSAYETEINVNVRRYASEMIIKILSNKTIKDYIKYRILYHVFNPYYKERTEIFNAKEILKIKQLCKKFIRKDGYELKVFSVYILFLLSSNKKEILKIIRDDEILEYNLRFLEKIIKDKN